MALYRGKGGAVFELSNPPQAQIDSGDLVLVEKPKPAKKAKPASKDS